MLDLLFGNIWTALGAIGTLFGTIFALWFRGSAKAAEGEADRQRQRADHKEAENRSLHRTRLR